jgi:hypothetical protein
MKTTLNTFTDTLRIVREFLEHDLGLDYVSAQRAITDASLNAYRMAEEEQDAIHPSTGDYSYVQSTFMSSLDGALAYHFRGPLSDGEIHEIAQATERHVEALLAGNEAPSHRIRFTVIVPAEVATPTYVDCHDGGGYSFDQTTTNKILNDLGLREKPLLDFNNVGGDYTTLCGYDNLLHIRFNRFSDSESFAQRLSYL